MCVCVCVRACVHVDMSATSMVACTQGFLWALASGLPSTPDTFPCIRIRWTPSSPGGFPGPGSLLFLRDQGCTTVLLEVAAGGGGVDVGLLPSPGGGGGSEQLPLQGAWLLRMEAEGEEGWGLGTSASLLLSREEEQLQTCLSAQLFVSRSPRETEAAGSRKSRPAGPAVLLPRPQVLTPEQNRQTRRDWKGPPSSHLTRASLGPLCLSAVQTPVCHPRRG